MTCPCQYPDPKPVFNDYFQITDVYCGACGGNVRDRPAKWFGGFCIPCGQVLRLKREGLKYSKACCGKEWVMDTKTAIALLPVGKS